MLKSKNIAKHTQLVHKLVGEKQKIEILNAEDFVKLKIFSNYY